MVLAQVAKQLVELILGICGTFCTFTKAIPRELQKLVLSTIGSPAVVECLWHSQYGDMQTHVLYSTSQCGY